MDPLLIVVVIGLAPVLVFTLLQANAAMAFLALCLGSVLGQFVGGDLIAMLRGYIPPNSPVTESMIRLMLLWLPVLLVALFMMHTLAKKQLLLNILPALAVGLMGILLSVPFLTPAAQATIHAHSAWHFVADNQALIVAGGTMIGLIFLRLRKNGALPKHKMH